MEASEIVYQHFDQFDLHFSESLINAIRNETLQNDFILFNGVSRISMHYSPDSFLPDLKTDPILKSLNPLYIERTRIGEIVVFNIKLCGAREFHALVGLYSFSNALIYSAKATPAFMRNDFIDTTTRNKYISLMFWREKRPFSHISSVFIDMEHSTFGLMRNLNSQKD